MHTLMLGNEAVARGCWEAGVALGTGYPGTPSTEILEALAHFEDVHTQWAPNEKVALEVAVGASLAGVRSIATMKHVGLNVAADPFFSASYMGVGGGLVVVSADDPGMHSSQDEQDNRHFARAAKVVMVEPSDPEEARWMTREGFALSERFDTPVLLRMTTRVCHQTAVVKPEPRQAPASRGYARDIARHVLLPAHARQRRPAVEQRLADARAFGESSDLWNPIVPGIGRTGVVTSGISYGYVREAAPDFPVLKLGLTWPLPLARIRAFAATVDRLVVVEELDPFLEDALRAAGIAVDPLALPRSGELGLASIERALLGRTQWGPVVDVSDLRLPPRPPSLCPGCSHRGMFTLFRDLKLRVMGDIGCYTLGAVKPMASMDACLCMGASLGMAHSMERFLGDRRSIGVIGDSTFFHSGIPALLDMVVNGSTATVVVLDNRWTAMTGRQPNPGTGLDIHGRSAPRIDVATVCQGLGVSRVVKVDPYDLEATRKILEEELAAQELSVIVAEAPCILGSRVPPRAAVQVDPDLCNRCGACIRLACTGMHEHDGFPEVDAALCNGCRICVQMCEKEAIR